MFSFYIFSITFLNRKSCIPNFSFLIVLDKKQRHDILAGVLAVVIALLAVSYLAFRAAAANPVDSLRYE